MGTELPPSKFGAGYTYGGGADAVPAPAPVPPAPTQPAFAPTPTPDPFTHAQAYSTAQPDPVGYAPVPPTTVAAPPTAYAATPAYPVGYPMKQQYAGSGGTAITASVLSFIGVLWNGTYAFMGVMALIGLTVAASSPHSYGNDGGMMGIAIALSIVMVLGPIILLIGGIQLLMHKRGGRWSIVIGSLLSAVGPAAFLLAMFGVFKALSTAAGTMGATEGASASRGFSQMADTFLLINGAPLLITALTIILALVPATRRWCEPAPTAYTP